MKPPAWRSQGAPVDRPELGSCRYYSPRHPTHYDLSSLLFPLHPVTWLARERRFPVYNEAPGFRPAAPHTRRAMSGRPHPARGSSTAATDVQGLPNVPRRVIRCRSTHLESGAKRLRVRTGGKVKAWLLLIQSRGSVCMLIHTYRRRGERHISGITTTARQARDTRRSIARSVGSSRVSTSLRNTSG
jgi:hypothetical protein